MSEEVRIAVIDTLGKQKLPPEAAEMMPHANLTGWSPADTDSTGIHPHGFMASWFAGILHFPDPIEMRYYQVFDGINAKYVGQEAERSMEEDLIDFAPTDINNSRGATWDRIKGNAAAVKEYKDQAAWWNDLMERMGNPRDNWASGNDEDPDLSRNEPDDDVAAPQRFIDQAVVVGSTDIEGVPSGFSSDGPRVDCSGWGEWRWLLEFDKWVAGSGTSFSTPEVCGVRSFLGLDYLSFMERLLSDEHFGTRPIDWPLGKHHAKFGYTNLMNEWQKIFRARVPKQFWPPHRNIRSERLRWMDMTLLEDAA
jgi:hypothetical protein